MDYKTSDQGIAAWLLLQGYECVGAVPVEGDEKRKDFVFINVTSPYELAAEYTEGRAVGRLKDFRTKLQFLNRLIRNESLTEEEMEELRG